jgi:two-component system cell cycle response regulator DivK
LGQVAPDPANPLPGAGRLVLVAEDYGPNLELITEYLEFEGFRVEPAKDGREAVAKVQALRPDIVLMDMKMPEMDGLEATRCLRREPTLRELPIIALTAFASREDEKTSQEAGANAHVTKPVDFDLLRSQIDRLLVKKPSSDPGI